MKQRHYIRRQSEELATELWEACVGHWEGKFEQRKVMHLLLRAHEVICDQQEALRMAAEVRGAAAELERLHARLAKTYGHLIKPKEPD